MKSCSRRVKLWLITGAMIGASFGAFPVAIAGMLAERHKVPVSDSVLMVLWPAFTIACPAIAAGLAYLIDWFESRASVSEGSRSSLSVSETSESK